MTATADAASPSALIDGRIAALADWRGAALARVRALIQHPDFDPKTPNRWRAVVQAFAGNPAAFHAEDGSGYDVLVEQVLMVDAFNPMTAARLVEPLSRFRIYASPWREAMQAALTRIRDAPGLSKNVLELSAKALDG